MTYRLAALCAGTGALEMGLQLAGVDHELVWYSEIDPHASKVLAHHHPHVPNLGDLTKITNPPAVDIVTAGFPCTDISPAGKKAGIHGKNSGLWWDIADLVGRLRPRFIVLENSADIVHRGGPAVVGSLTELGYDCRWTTLRASDVGACHQRKRWFAVANTEGQRLERGRQTRHRWTGPTDSDPPAGLGKHGTAVQHWADLTRPAPPLWGDDLRITPAAAEWMQGLPEGHVTGVPDLSRAQMLKILGNGCVPAQCAEAVRQLA